MDASNPVGLPPVDGGVGYTGPTVNGTVTVNRATPMGKMVPGYAGFSFEKSHVTDGFFTGTNAPLIAMFKLLGPGYLRLGGHDVDSRTWQANAMPVPGGTTSQVVGTADVDALAAFLQATGWKAIYGLNLIDQNDVTNDVAEATYVEKTLGPSLHSFEIGNEWGGQLESKWQTYEAAIRAAVPNAKESGPGACCGTGFPISFAKTEASKIVLLTYHRYIGVAGPGATMAALLNPDPGLIPDTRALVAAAAANNLRDGFRWGETNTFAHHGQQGVSDAYGSALWGIDHMMTTAEYGAAGVNYHGGGQNMDGNNCPSGPASCGSPFRYSPIDEVDSRVSAAAPLFYGMLFVSHAGTGPMFATSVSVANNLNVTAYSVGQTNGATNVIIVNKDSANGFDAIVDVGVPVVQASAEYLRGPGLSSTSGVTFAGSGVSPAGAWQPNAPFALSAAGSKLTVLVPPISAVLVHAN